MHIATFHRTLVAFDLRTHRLRQTARYPEPGSDLRLLDIPDAIVAQLP